jgi:hypothetical protein
MRVLTGAGKVKEVCSLDNQGPVKPILCHQSLKLADPALNLF